MTWHEAVPGNKECQTTLAAMVDGPLDMHRQPGDAAVLRKNVTMLQSFWKPSALVGRLTDLVHGAGRSAAVHP